MISRRRQRLGLSSIAFAILLVTGIVAGWLQSQREAPAVTTAPAVAIGARYDLARDERRGGHTLERHVGRSESDLIDRLSRERGISAASTYVDQDTAERVVAQTLVRYQSRVDQWLARDRQRPNLVLDYHGGEPIGLSVRRGARQGIVCTEAVVVLRWDGGEGFYVLTSYPE